MVPSSLLRRVFLSDGGGSLDPNRFARLLLTEPEKLGNLVARARRAPGKAFTARSDARARRGDSSLSRLRCPGDLALPTRRVQSRPIANLMAVAVLAMAIGLSGCRETEPPAPAPASSGSVDAAEVKLPELIDQAAGVSERLQAVSALSDRVAWVSGLGGVWARTLDGGDNWQSGGVEGHADLQFRDVHAVSAEVAYLLSSGPGPLSRVFKTLDGGDSWRQLLVATEAESFWDCFDFWDAERGLLFGDSVAGQIEIWRTLDAGTSWSRLDSVPAALEGEGGFAASGGCLETREEGGAVFVTGASATARRFVTTDWGDSWSVQDLPLPSGEAKGATATVRLSGPEGGETDFIFGGDIGDPEGGHQAVVLSADQGATWSLGPRPGYPGPIYGAAVAQTPAGPALVVVGPMGAAVSFDRGEEWRQLSDHNYWSVDFGEDGTGWMVGPEGRITRVRFDG